MRISLLSVIFIIIQIPVFSQLKREMRAVWIAHVNNIDFPSSANLSASQQKTQFIAILDDFAKNNINAAIVQIRTNCDASYPSELEPWSAFWAGKQGTGPGYDPLQFMIDECHKRNIEFHAWFNPYRAAPSASTFAADNHVRKTHPEWIIAYNGLQMLDPAIPEVREYVTRVIIDVVHKYDIDAVHFDDYFYPYPVTGVTLNDDASYAIHNRGFTNRADWRRDNINILVKMVNENIKKVKPWVKFGISPFGIWKNKTSSQPEGSDTKGLEAFHSIYADSKKWVQEGWVDYLAPQIYWSIGFSIANFAVLTPWWAENKGNLNRHLYIGHAAYRINNGGTDLNWSKPGEMPQQINLTRNVNGVNGSIFYNTTSFRKNLLGFNDSLQSLQYKKKAFVPLMPWIDNKPPEPVAGLKIERSDLGWKLSWDTNPQGLGEMDKVSYYAIYRHHDSMPMTFDNNENLIAIINKNDTSFIDNTFTSDNNIYTITAFDRLHNESAPNSVSTQKPSNIHDINPKSIDVGPPYPNPFTTSVSIKFHLAKSDKIRLDVFDQRGQWLSTPFSAHLNQGEHEITYEGSQLTAGIYFITLSTSTSKISRKIVKSTF